MFSNARVLEVTTVARSDDVAMPGDAGEGAAQSGSSLTEAERRGCGEFTAVCNSISDCFAGIRRCDGVR